MSIYGSVLFERKHEKMLKEINRGDRGLNYYMFFDCSLTTVSDTLQFYNIAKKTSRKVCRLRDIFWNLAYDEYHDDTDNPYESDRVQMYHFGKMEIFR